MRSPRLRRPQCPSRSWCCRELTRTRARSAPRPRDRDQRACGRTSRDRDVHAHVDAVADYDNGGSWAFPERGARDDMTMTGHCLCGAVRYYVDTEPTITANCH